MLFFFINFEQYFVYDKINYFIMNYCFDEENIKLISNILETESNFLDDCYSWDVKSRLYKSAFAVNLYVNIKPKNTITISIQTAIGYYELHDIKCWNHFSNEEVVFFADSGSYLSCVFISKENGISIYANIEKNILELDINEVDPALLLGIMQLNIYSNYKNEKK